MSPHNSIYRLKLLNAVLYFARNTKHLNMTKLSKLLYFLDFGHFKATGYPSIGLRYYAFERGPVPKDFWVEVREGRIPDDFRGKLIIRAKEPPPGEEIRELEFRAVQQPDMSVFTPREKQLLEKIAFMYRDLRAWQISEVSHLVNEPWDVTKREKGLNCLIDYMLAVDQSGPEAESARESLGEYYEALENFPIRPTRI